MLNRLGFRCVIGGHSAGCRCVHNVTTHNVYQRHACFLGTSYIKHPHNLHIIARVSDNNTENSSALHSLLQGPKGKRARAVVPEPNRSST